MTADKPYVLSIAGFDPTAGAGILSDIKTFESNGVYGLGVLSALTWQTDVAFEKVEWIDVKNIISQLEMLLNRFEIHFIKIGLVENLDVLQQLICYLQMKINDPIIVFDPILKASAGFVFHHQVQEQLFEVIDRIYCITPNIPEANQLFGEHDLHDKLTALSNKVNIYLKGGHGNKSVSTDYLFTQKHAIPFSNDRLATGEKHGSGCVLSSNLTAQLALGHDIKTAAEKANQYTYHFLSSNDSLLGYHQLIQ